MEDTMTIASTMVGNGAVKIRPEGEIDIYTAPALKRHLQDAMEAGIPRILIDLTATTYLDATALGVMVGALKQHCDATKGGVEGNSIEIILAPGRIHRVFEITGLDRLFTIHPTVEAAFDAEKKPVEV